MEEVIEQLREANEPVPVPLELPDEDQLVEIEEQLFINIPFVFKEFLLTVSDVVYGSLEPVTCTDPHSHTYLPDVAANAWDAGVPRDLIPLCQDGESYYCVEEDGTVVLIAPKKPLPRRAGNRCGTGHGMYGWRADIASCNDPSEVASLLRFDAERQGRFAARLRHMGAPAQACPQCE